MPYHCQDHRGQGALMNIQVTLLPLPQILSPAWGKEAESPCEKGLSSLSLGSLVKEKGRASSLGLPQLPH